MRDFLCMVFTAFMISVCAAGQNGFNYQMTMISNPALAGGSGDGFLRLSYQNLYPGDNLDLHSVIFSFDGFFPDLHGGAGFFISDEYLGGMVNNLDGGFSYSYLLQAGKKLWLSAGLSASFYHRGYNFGSAVLPDQIDPLMGAVLPSAEALTVRGRSVFDLGTGFMLMTDGFFGGFSVGHLTEPDPSGSDIADGKLKRTLLIHGSGNFILSSERELRIMPIAAIETGKGFLTGGAGASLESKYLSFNVIAFADNSRNLDLQTGFSFGMGSWLVFYNYCFNMLSGENLMPFSLQHHTGIALRLNNVDKRKILKTINFPKL